MSLYGGLNHGPSDPEADDIIMFCPFLRVNLADEYFDMKIFRINAKAGKCNTSFPQLLLQKTHKLLRPRFTRYTRELLMSLLELGTHEQ